MQLPLHAAGIYTGAHQTSCSDFFVASYTPSIEALLNAQRTLKPLRCTAAEALVVAVDNPSEGNALPMTTEEVDTIHRLVPSKVAQASRCFDVLKHIQSASVLHLACHGSQNATDALQSGFTLDDGLLTVSKLMELELPNAFLAVLSACETAKGDATQPDQAVHLAASMLFAGFKSVVATMW
jgi:CHAT domain-containing protein